MVLHEAAIGSIEGSASLSDPGEGEWGHRTARDHAGNLSILSMNSLLESSASGNGTPFIVKIDIEGAEADLFAANTDWVQRFDLLIIESHD